ncbi:MAG: hypothetical protein AB8G95_12540 [Anaerolineae bacterium]
MTFGFPAFHTEKHPVSPNRSQHIHEDIKRTLSSLSWGITEKSANQILASTSVSLWSWGEKIIIDVLSDGSISVTSKCSLPTQCFDWGKNKTNVDQFLSELTK